MASPRPTMYQMQPTRAVAMKTPMIRMAPRSSSRRGVLRCVSIGTDAVASHVIGGALVGEGGCTGQESDVRAPRKKAANEPADEGHAAVVRGAHGGGDRRVAALR